jgi:hypothetical protein
MLPHKILEIRPVAVLMRHAERDQFKLGKETDPLLTKRGHRDSYELGRDLSVLAPVRIFHSPIKRCEQTAQELCRGLAENNGRCEINGVIEDVGPSLYVTDIKRIIMALEEQGSGFFRLWFDGKLPEDLIAPVEVAAERELSILTAQLTEDRHFTLNVSHDWNIMVLLEHYFKLKHEDIGYPGFLSGVVAYRENQTVHLYYGERRCAISLPHGR